MHRCWPALPPKLKPVDILCLTELPNLVTAIRKEVHSRLAMFSNFVDVIQATPVYQLLFSCSHNLDKHCTHSLAIAVLI